MLKKFMKQFVREEEGATMVEYAIMVALIAVAAIFAATKLGFSVTSTFESTSEEIGPGAPLGGDPGGYTAP